MMKDGFAHIEEAQVTLNIKGTFKIAEVYKRMSSDRVYAKHGSGFIRLGSGGFTSSAGVKYENLDAPFEFSKGVTGEPIMPSGPTTVTNKEQVAA